MKKLMYQVILQYSPHFIISNDNNLDQVTLSKLLYRLKWDIRLMQFSLSFSLSVFFISANCTKIFALRGHVVWNRLKWGHYVGFRGGLGLWRENTKTPQFYNSTVQVVSTCKSWDTTVFWTIFEGYMCILFWIKVANTLHCQILKKLNISRWRSFRRSCMASVV